MSQELYTTSGGSAPNQQESVRRVINNIYSLNDRHLEPVEKKPNLNPIYDSIYELSECILHARQRTLDTQFFVKPDRQDGVIKNIARIVFGNREPLTESHLKTKESSIVGATIFGGMTPYEIQREFFLESNDEDGFCHYFFHQAVEKGGIKDSVTLHYEVRPAGVLRISSKPGVANEIISGYELGNFIRATKLYHDRVLDEVYGLGADHHDKMAAEVLRLCQVPLDENGHKSGKIAA